MTLVVVPVRYPLTSHSRQTLQRGIREAEERGADLTVLHVNLFQNGERITRTDLKRVVEEAVGPIDRARYVIRQGFLVEETILEEAAAEGADVVVIGRHQAGRWRRTFRRLIDDPDIERYLTEKLDCEIVVTSD